MSEPIDENTRSRDWCYTLNNWTEDEYQILIGLNEKAQYHIYGKEIGKQGTPHIQGYIYFKSQITFKSIKKKLPNRSHIEQTKGTPQQASAYCMKDKQYEEVGTLPQKQGKRSDLDNVRDVLAETGKMAEVVQVATSYQSVRMAETILKYHEKKRNWKPIVKWFHGPTGTGKSMTAYEELGEDCYTTMDTGKWWEGYDAHENVHIEDMRKDFLKFHQLLKLLDRYAYRIECKGASRQFLAKKIIITSCYSPTEMYDTREDIGQLLRRIDEIKQFDALELKDNLL